MLPAIGDRRACEALAVQLVLVLVLAGALFTGIGCIGPFEHCEDPISPDFAKVSGTMSFAIGGASVESRMVEEAESLEGDPGTCGVHISDTTSMRQTFFGVRCPNGNGFLAGFSIGAATPDLAREGVGELELDPRDASFGFMPDSVRCSVPWPVGQPIRIVIDVARGSARGSGISQGVTDDLRREGRIILSVTDGDYAGMSSAVGQLPSPCTLRAGFSGEIAFVQTAASYRRTAETHCD